MTNLNEPMHLDEFTACLDAFGADLSRWPDGRAASATRLLETSSAAQTALIEARALEKVLSRAPTYRGAGPADLVDRIMVEALSAPGRESPSNVVPLRPPVRVVVREVGRTTRGTPWRTGAAAASLAASLILGIMIGMTDLAPPSVTAFVIAGADQADVDQTVAAAGFDGLTEALDGEQL